MSAVICRSTPAVQPIAFAQPVLDLVSAADEFGAEFNRRSDPERLCEVQANVRSLWEHAMSHAQRLTGTHKEALSFMASLPKNSPRMNAPLPHNSG